MIDLQYVKSYIAADGQGGVCGLHEIPPAIASRLPGHSESEILEACRTACSELLDAGHAALRMIPAFAERPTRDDYLPVEPDAIAAVLASAEAWQPPLERLPRYWVSTTEEGAAVYLDEEVFSL